jgi:hypothetical protein
VSLAFASKSQVALHGLFRAYFWQWGGLILGLGPLRFVTYLSKVTNINEKIDPVTQFIFMICTSWASKDTEF